jgi:hypothetical protein
MLPLALSLSLLREQTAWSDGGVDIAAGQLRAWASAGYEAIMWHGDCCFRASQLPAGGIGAGTPPIGYGAALTGYPWRSKNLLCNASEK